jgi:hypothetical protein
MRNIQIKSAQEAARTTESSTDPQEQIKRWFGALQEQGASPTKIERIGDKLRWTQNAGKPGVIEAVRFGYVQIDGERIDLREFGEK